MHSQRERILDAVTNLTARSGYAALTVEGIAAEASVSLQAFYEHFSDKEDAFLVAFEIGQDKALALVERAYDAQPDWRYGVRAGISALFGFLAGEPAFAHMAMIDVLAATERTIGAGVQGRGPLRADAAPRPRARPQGLRPPEVTVQAIGGGLFELMLHHALAAPHARAAGDGAAGHVLRAGAVHRGRGRGGGGHRRGRVGARGVALRPGGGVAPPARGLGKVRGSDQIRPRDIFRWRCAMLRAAHSQGCGECAGPGWPGARHSSKRPDEVRCDPSKCRKKYVFDRSRA